MKINDNNTKFNGYIEVKATCRASVYDSNLIYVKSVNNEVKWRVSKEIHDYIDDKGNREYTLYCVGGMDIFTERGAFIVMYARII